MNASRPLVLVASLLLAAGCGRDDGLPRAAATGKVTLDGQPLPEGMIRFIPGPDAAGPSAAAVIVNGEFTLSEDDGPIIARHRVEIEATGHYGFAIDDEQAYAAHVLAGGAPVTDNPIPPKYNHQSELVADVTTEGENQFQFHLTASLDQ